MSSDIAKAWKLLEVADVFLKKAKMSVMSSDKYNTFIKCSLDCLFNVIKLYGPCLNGQIESTIYYKISSLLFQETVSHDLAREYCVKGIQICKRNGFQLINVKFQLQYLNIQIQMRSNPNEREVISYLNEVIDEIPDLKEFTAIKIFFVFTRITKFEVNRSLLSRARKLEELILEFEPVLNEDNYKLYQIIVFNLIQMKTINNPSLNETKVLLDKMDQLKYELPIQFKGIKLFININSILQLNDYSKMRNSLKELNSFLKTSSNGWSESIIIKLMHGFSVEFKWISYEEYSIHSFLILGVSNMYKEDDISIKIFNKCKKLIKTRLDSNSNSNRLSLNDMSLSKLKLTSQLYLIDFYLIVIDLMNNKYPQMDEINEIDFSNYPDFNDLIKRFQSKSLNQFESITFNDFKYLIVFLKGMIYQRYNQIDKAIDNYSFIVSTINDVPLNIKKNQIKDLIGSPNYLSDQTNQILSLSLLNILPMLEKRVNTYKFKQTIIDEFDSKYNEIMKQFEINLKMKQMVLDKLDDMITRVKDRDVLLYFTILNLKIAINNINDEEEVERIIELFKLTIGETSAGEKAIHTLTTPVSSSPMSIGDKLHDANETISLIPVMKSMIYFTIGDNDRSITNRYSIEDNINSKLLNYSRSIELSKGPRGNTKLIDLANNRISKIKERNPKLFRS